MRCHYEVLGVERDANDDKLKKSYRKLALQWHPDKNLDRADECTKVFHEIQEAYEVLTDPQERAWYDKHREAILRGGDDYVDNAFDIMGCFNSSLFSGYGDDANGFYAVYANVFHKIDEEDEPYKDEDNDESAPEFGNSQSSFEEVVRPFYAYWQSYCTLRTYVWEEKYDIRQAPNRPTQRLMEKENKKLRDASRKARNEEVQELVAFVRKRDERVKAYRKELEEKQKEQKIAFEKKRNQHIKEKNEQLKNYKEQEWMDYNNLSKQLADIDAHFNDDFKLEAKSNEGEQNESEEEFETGFYCVACDKPFKSEKALVNHEKSKKHKVNVELIKKEMEKDLLTSSNTQVNSSIGEECSSEEFERHEPEGSENPTEIINQPSNIENNVDDGNDFESDEELADGSSISYIHQDSLFLPVNQTLLKQINRQNVSCTENESSDRNLIDASNMQSSQRDECIGEEATNTHMGDLDYIDNLSRRDISHSDSNLNYVHMDSLNLPAMRARRQARLKNDNEENSSDEDEWNAFVNRGISRHLGVSPNDSLNLPRRTSSKKKQMRTKQEERREDLPDLEEDAVGVLMKHDKKKDIDQKGMPTSLTNDGEFEAKYADAQLGFSFVTNSLKINKKKTKARRKKKKQQLFNIQEDDTSGSEIDNNIDHIIIADGNKNAPEDLHRNNCMDEHLSKETFNNQGNILSDIDGCQTQTNVNLDKKKEKPSKDKDFVGLSGTLFKCNVCQAVFPTRNKLFGHVKTEGHALNIEEDDTRKKTKKGKKKSKC